MIKPYLIVISGGGFNQIECAMGTLMALYDLGIPLLDSTKVDYHGTSAGAICSCIVASGCRPFKAISILKSTKTEDLIAKKWFPFLRLLLGEEDIYDRSGLEKILYNIIDGEVFENVKVIVTVDSNESMLAVKGGFKACLASSAIEGVFEKVKISGKWCKDGGYTNNVDFEPADEHNYEKIFIILPPQDLYASRHRNTSIGRLLQGLDTKISQEVNETERIYRDHSVYKNIWLLRPPPCRTSMLSWSEGFNVIEKSYFNTIKVLNEEFGPIKEH